MTGLKRLCFFVFATLAAMPAWAATSASLKLLTPASYVPGIPMLVRVELRNAEGKIDRETWDAEAILNADEESVQLSTNRVRMINGLGTVLVAIDGEVDFTLTAESEGHSANRLVESLAGEPWTEVSGTLAGDATVWSGIIHVTNDVIVPEDHTLTIASNTWVLVDAVTAGPPAPDLLIHGTFESLGTETHPVTITSADPVLHWGQIRHETAPPSVYRHTIVTRAGQAPREPHTNRGPAIRCTDTELAFFHCTISDHADASGRPGKVMQTTNSVISITDCVMARSRMGPEFMATTVHCTNTWFVEMNAGIDDEDGIYIHYQSPGGTASLIGCVVADVTDDGVDTIGSDLVVRDCIIRDVRDKGMSITGGESEGHVLVENCLIVDCSKGLSSKGSRTHLVFVNRTTISVRDQGIFAEKRTTSTTSLIRYHITNSIVEATAPGGVAIHTDYGITNVPVHYSNILNTNWPGTGIIDLDPMFVDRANHNFHLLPGSPCIDAGDPDAAPDPDGTRADLGVFPFSQDPPADKRLLSPHFTAGGLFSFVLASESNQVFDIQGTSDFTNWTSIVIVTNDAPPLQWIAPDNSSPQYFYRAQSVP